jgi:hypothetical protein
MKPMLTRSGVVAAVSLLALLTCQAVAKPRTVAPPPPPAPVAPPPPPPTTLSNTVTMAAAAYEGYVHTAAAMTPNFTDPASVQTSMQASASYEPKQLARGMVAYAAVLALQDPAFVAGVKQYSKDPNQRADIAARIYSDPRYASAMPGADGAAGLIISRLASDGEAIHKASAAIKQSAYDIQHQKWSMTIVQDRDGRLAGAKRLSSATMTPSADDSARLMQAAVSGQGMTVTPSAAHGPYTDTVNRGLALAALAVLGSAGDDHIAEVNSLMDDQSGPFCLSMSKLNLYQCLAVSRPQYEDVFCMGPHGLMDTGRCVQKVVGAAPAEVLEVTRMDQAKAEAEAKKAADKAKHAATHGKKKKKK